MSDFREKSSGHGLISPTKGFFAAILLLLLSLNARGEDAANSSNSESSDAADSTSRDRTLDTEGVAAENNSTTLFPIPLEFLQAFGSGSAQTLLPNSDEERNGKEETS
jgi:hypothetical protein